MHRYDHPIRLIDRLPSLCGYTPLGEARWERQVQESAKYGTTFCCHATTGNSGREYGAFGTLVLPRDRSVTHIGNEVRSVHTDQED